MFAHKEKLIHYLEKLRHNTTSLRTALLNDLHNCFAIAGTWFNRKIYYWTLDETFVW